MKLGLLLAPRRLVLCGFILLGLGLRLWGLAWGPQQAAALHPGEWTSRIIEQLSFEQPLFPGVWTQTFFSLAALLKGALSLVAGLGALLLGEARSLTEVALPARLAGRLTVALLGAGQIPLAYLVGRRYFDSVGTGMLAAALTAVCPLLVAHSHYLSLDIPLGFALLVCLLLAHSMSEAPRATVMGLAGLAWGLAVTTRASGALLAPLWAAAYLLGVFAARPAKLSFLLVWPLCFLGGLLLGLNLGYPGFIIDPDQAERALGGSVALPPMPGGWPTYLGERWMSLLGVLGRTVGWSTPLLWGVGVALLLWRREPRRLLVAFLPPLFLLAGLGLLGGSAEGITAVWLPVATVLAAWPLMALCRRLPGFYWQVAGITFLGLALCAGPLWRSLKAGYLFWQEDTMTSARSWLEGNLAEDSRVLVGPRTPLDLALPSRPLDPELTYAGLLGSGHYLLVSNLGAAEKGDLGRRLAGEPAGEVRAEDLDERLQLVKRFDLKASPLEETAEDADFPRWVSPRLEVYAAEPPSRVVTPLALERPGVGLGQGFAMVYGDYAAYGLGEGGMWIGGGGMAQRVLRLGRTPARLGISLANQGQDLAVAVVSQGPWPGTRVVLYPGQELDLPLATRAWPPWLAGFFPVKVSLLRGSDFWARLYWNPLIMARRTLEADDPARAAELLAGLGPEERNTFDAGALLAAALVRLKRFEEAGAALAALGDREDGVAADYRALAVQPLAPEDWNRRFARLTGYHPGLLERSTTLDFLISAGQCRAEGEGMSLSGPGYFGSWREAGPQRGSRLRLWLRDPLPRGDFRAELELAGSGPSAGEAGRLELVGHGAAGEQVLASQAIAAGGPGRRQVTMPFRNPRPGFQLELRMEGKPGVALSLERLRVGLDLKAHLRAMLGWYLEASGLWALKAGRFAQAVADLEELLALDPERRAILLPLARALLDTGRAAPAFERTRRAEELFDSQPERLAEVRDLYQEMLRPEDVARVERRLGFLRPSLKREARFAGGLTLLGYDLPRAMARRGEEVAAGWYWRCWAPPALDYFVFVHLRGRERTLNYDHLLDHGRLAMPNLAVGQVVREDYRLAIPPDAPPGTYRLVVGLWDPRFTSKGVMVLEGAGQGREEVFLGEIEVVP